MDVTAAYLNHHLPAVVDNSKPLIVTSCGNYRIKTRSSMETKRPKGRKDYQLLYLASGKGHFVIKGKEHVLSAGTMIIYRPDEPQDYAYYAEDKTDVFWVHFTGAEADTILNEYRMSASYPVMDVGTSPDFQWIFGQIILELQLCRPHYEELLALLLRNIFLLISRSIENSKTYSDATEKKMIAAMHYFRAHYNQEINIAEYAKSCSFSLSWFIRCFQQITGKTPLQYIIALRISNAQSLLENTDCTISEIAEGVGYSNALYFSRIFHKQTGMSPKEYRRIRKG